ncbi:amidohydrolase [Sedimentibacter acidaminivorans]|uniref:Amidohydrolase n=1 Tax=Sedimentibacter acidaminivorans TaxID=913099 RepID=A0ABS4G9D0_9FIRM|nr:amidohydrolase [Sedimentibacter acidaminivorans]MBP1924279.1 amidohydrolase [Sedimentibacter acidaminivorans]
MDLDKIIKKYKLDKEIIEIRRHIHQNPELSEMENETTKYICGKLDEWNIEHIKGVANTGVVAIIRGNQPGNTVAIRGDIDALPICEETNLDFASINKGIMHACGHDSHVSILLITARIISLLKEELKGNVKFFFQPAEETIGGAERMIKDGCMENPKVDYVLGLHVDPTYDAGIVGIRYGKMYAASDIIDLNIRGKSAHGAHPNEGIDTISVTANIINTVQTVISRNVSPLNSAVCTFGMIKGGTVRNQIADNTRLEGITRTLDQETRLSVREKIRAICENVGRAMGAQIEFNVTESYSPLVNNDEVTSLVEMNAKALVGEKNVVLEEFPDLSCEDFSYFAMNKPACYFHLGCYNQQNGPRVDLHHPKFTIDEKCMIIGVKLQVENVVSLLNKGV